MEYGTLMNDIVNGNVWILGLITAHTTTTVYTVVDSNSMCMPVETYVGFYSSNFVTCLN